MTNDEIRYDILKISSKIEKIKNSIFECVTANMFAIADKKERSRIVWQGDSICLTGKKSIGLGLFVPDNGSSIIKLFGSKAVSELIVVYYKCKENDSLKPFIGSSILVLNSPKKRKSVLLGTHNGSFNTGIFFSNNRFLSSNTIEISLDMSKLAKSKVSNLRQRRRF